MITTLQDEIKRVLKKSKTFMTSKEIVNKIIKRKNYKFWGKTPHASIYSILITDIKNKGDKSIFKKVDNKFTIK